MGMGRVSIRHPYPQQRDGSGNVHVNSLHGVTLRRTE